MSKYALNAETRDYTGKEKAKKLRAAGRFPAIVYGDAKDPVSLTLDTRETENVLTRIHGEKVLVDLSYGGKQEKVFVRNIQRDPVNEKLIHVDFFRVDMEKELDTTVPVIAIGTAYGVKMGGLLEPGLRQVQLRALPGDVPPHIEVNVESLNVGQSFHVSDLKLGDKIKLLSRGETVLFSVHGKAAEETPATPAAAAAAPAGK